MNRRRVALVGVTGYGGVHFKHLRALAEAGECEFAAAAVVNPEHPDAAGPLAWLRANGAAAYRTAEELFAAEKGRIDLVCLPVGIASHEPLVAAALAAGADVLVEKPAAGCTAAVDRMIEAERAAAPRRVFVGFQHVWAPETRQIMQILASGTLGAPLRIASTGIWPRGDAYYQRNAWAARLAAPDGTPVRDSPVNNAFAHYLNLCLLYAGASAGEFGAPAAPTAVEGALFRARPEIETFDTCLLRFGTDSGVPVDIAFSHAAERNAHPRIRVECERGDVRWAHDGPWEVRAVDGRVLASGTAVPPHAAMFRAVVAQSREGTAAQVGGFAPHGCSLSMARAQVLAVELLTETLPVRPLEHDAIRRDDGGQWIVPGIEEAFDRFFENGTSVIPEWK